MSYKDQDKCIAKAYPDEMLFVLMARDSTAPDVIDFWIILNRTKQPAEKLAEARACAQTMRETRGQIITRVDVDLNKKNYLSSDTTFPEINTVEAANGTYIKIDDLVKYLNRIAIDIAGPGGNVEDKIKEYEPIRSLIIFLTAFKKK